MTSAASPAGVTDPYKAFEQMLLATFKVADTEDLPFKRVDHLFQIFSNTQDFSYHDPEERVSNFLLLAACLYSIEKKEKVCFIAPTYYYAQQAATMRNECLVGLGATKESSFPTVVPGMEGYNESVQKCSIVFMHGRDYSDYLPKGWTGRKVIQIFPGVDVPVDPRRISSCSFTET